MNDVLEIVKVIVSPVEKLLEVIAIGCGKLYEPTHIKRTAKARAEELKLIGNGITDGIYLPTKYENGQITIDTTKQSDLLLRAQQRLLFQESEKQQNIESVIVNAYKELENVTEASDEPVDKDWILRFFNSVENISNEDMQKLWGKMLAGEVKRPGTYSYRTMFALSTFTSKDVQLIDRVFSCIVKSNELNILIDNETVIPTDILNVLEIETLKNIGILSSEGLRKTITLTNDKVIIGISKNLICILKESTESEKISISFTNLTDIGNELYSLGDYNSDETLIAFAKSIKKKNGEFAVTLNRINYTSGDTINYQEEDLLK